MTNEQLTELLHLAVDGVASDSERHELQRHLDADPATATEFERLRRLVDAIGAMEEEEAPADLADAVLARISATPVTPVDRLAQAHRRRIRFTFAHFVRSITSHFTRSTSEHTMSIQNKQKTWIIGGLAIAVFAIIYFAAVSPWPAENEVPGTVGGIQKAEKYRSAQMSTSDVALKNPEIQKFIQSAAFDKIQNNAALQAALSSAEVQAALESAEVRAFLTSAEVRAALESAEVRAALESAEVRAALESAEVKAALESADLRSRLKSAEVRALLANAEARAMLKNAEVRALLANAEVRSLLASAEARAMLSSAEVRALLSSADLRVMLFNADLRVKLSQAEAYTR